MNTPYEFQTVFYWIVENVRIDGRIHISYLHGDEVVFSPDQATRFRSYREAQQACDAWTAKLTGLRLREWRATEHGFTYYGPAGFDPLMELVELVADCRDDQLGDQEYEEERLALLNAEIKALRVDAERYRAANMQIDPDAPSNIIGGPRNE